MCLSVCAAHVSWKFNAQLGVTALMEAAGGGHIALVEFLLNRGAQVSTKRRLEEEENMAGSLFAERRGNKTQKLLLCVCVGMCIRIYGRRMEGICH